MIDKEQARELVKQYLMNRAPDRAKDWEIYEETTDRPYGWVFYYNHRRYIVYGHERSKLAGNGPILVIKETGAIHAFGTAAPLEVYLEPFEKM